MLCTLRCAMRCATPCWVGTHSRAAAWALGADNMLPSLLCPLPRAQVWDALSPRLSGEELEWLRQATAPLRGA